MGRFRIITYQQVDASKLSVTYYYDTMSPANPEFKDMPLEFISDNPYQLHGTKEPYSSIWLSHNQSVSQEVVPLDDKDTWSYQIYLNDGNNIIQIYSKDQMENQSETVEGTPINYFAYFSKDMRIINAAKGWFTFGVRDTAVINEQLGHRLVKNDLAKTPFGLLNEMQADIEEATNNNWLKVKFYNIDIVTNYKMTIKYINLLDWDNPVLNVGIDELGIDPINGRFIIGPGSALVDITPNANNLSTIHYFDQIPPAPPEIVNVPEDQTEFTTDCPFIVRGVKTPYSSAWLRMNETGDFIEASPVDTILAWTNSQGVYLQEGRNIIEVYSKDYCENQSTVSKYTLDYELIKPALQEDSFVVDQCYTVLQGLKGRNSGIEYTTNLDTAYKTAVDPNTNLIWEYQFTLRKGANTFYIRTVDQGGNQSDPVTAEIVYNYQNPSFEVYSPTTSSTQWIIGSIGKKTLVNDTNIVISCSGITVGSVIPIWGDGRHFTCKLTGFNNTAVPYLVDIYTIDEAENHSDTIQEEIVYDPDAVGEETIKYEWENENLNISWDAPPSAVNYKVFLSRKASEIDIDTVDSRFSDTTELNLDFLRKLDSPYLTFHIKPNTSENITHKRINARQLTTLTPFFENFKRKEILNQGTFFMTNEWLVNETYSNLKNTNSSGIAMIYIPRISPTWSSYEYEVKLKKQSGVNIDISLLYKVRSKNNYYEFNIKDSQSTHRFNDQVIVDPVFEQIVLNDYKKIKLVVKYHKPSGNTYVKSYIENGSGEMKLKDHFVYPMFPYGGVGLKVKDCQVEVDYIKITPLN